MIELNVNYKQIEEITKATFKKTLKACATKASFIEFKKQVLGHKKVKQIKYE